MKMIASLALIAGALGLAAPSASALDTGFALSLKPSTIPVCDCDQRADAPAGYVSGFVGSPYSEPYVTGGYDAGFTDDRRYSDESGAAPPYAFFPSRERVYRMWGWAPRARDGYGN